MDKETLSNYGWVVICVLVLVVKVECMGGRPSVRAKNSR